MKKRTIVGLLCVALALVVSFVLAPRLYQQQTRTVSVVQLARNVGQGTVLAESDVKLVDIPASAIPDGALTDPAQAVGQYTTAALFAGDTVTSAKVSRESSLQSEDVLATLDGSKVAVSITIDSFAAGLSGKLKNGDIISLIVTGNNGLETVIPKSLTYVPVITTTTSGGVDTDAVAQNEDGSYTLPSTITVLVTPAQAVELAQYDSNATLHAALVYRGDAQTAQTYLDQQEEMLNHE